MGYDYIKVYEKLNKKIYDAIIDEAKRQNIEVVGHVPDEVGIRHVISSGQVSIEHLDNYYFLNSSDNKPKIKKEVLDKIVENKIWSCPTIVVSEMYENRDKNFEGIKYISPSSKIEWQTHRILSVK